MKLVSCHVENFGKLRDFSLDFREGFSSYCYENGWGKSTLAAFIRVMFYGFEGEKNRVEGRERTIYQPWQGGVYGGQIVFEAGGKRYKISRVFGKKESEDSFELRDGTTNLVSHDYTSAIGRELFEIDSESFMRTVFISQKDCATNTTGDINAKMGNLTENTDDLTNYDGADKRLLDLLNSMSPTRKTGSIKQLKSRASQLELDMKEEDAIDRGMISLQEILEEKKAYLEKLRADQKEIANRQSKASKLKEIQAKKERYEEILTRYQKAEKELLCAREAFPGRVPEREELDKISDACIDLKQEKTYAVANALSEREEERFSILNARFSEEPLDGEKIRLFKGKNNKLLSLREKEKEEMLERLMRQQEVKKQPPYLVIGIIIAAAGAALCIRALLPGVALFLLGIVSAAVGAVKNKGGQNEALTSKEDGLSKECQELFEEILGFFKTYQIEAKEPEFGAAFISLETDGKEYEGLKQKKTNLLLHEKQSKEKKEEILEALSDMGFLEERDLYAEILRIKEMLQTYQSVQNHFLAEKKRKEDFERAGDMGSVLDAAFQGEIENLNDLNAAFEEKQEEIDTAKNLIAHYEQQMNDYRQKSDEISEKKEELSNLRERIYNDLRKYELLGRTQEFLKTAKESLTARYIAPLKSRFSRYYRLISGDEAVQYHMDANAVITVNEQGMQREIKYCSEGYKDLIGLCLRLAFVDVMYPGEKPMIILDDPFVNLDGAKIGGGKRLLLEISKEYQVIYFTCHESRR